MRFFLVSLRPLAVVLGVTVLVTTAATTTTTTTTTAAFTPTTATTTRSLSSSSARHMSSTKEKTMGAKTSGLLVNHRYVVEGLPKAVPEIATGDTKMSEMERLRFALQFKDLNKAVDAVKQRYVWSQGPGKDICTAAAQAVAEATANGGWDNAPVRAAAPHAHLINDYITPKSVITLSTDEGDLVYVIRASLIDDKALMDRVTVEQLGDYFLYAKEVHSIVANARSAQTGRLCNVIFANDISGVRKAPDKRFSQALTSSSDQYEVLYPSLAGPTMILNLPFILQAFVGLLKPLFPKSVQERLLFSKAPVLKSLSELTPLATDPTTKQKFVQEIKSLLP